MKQLFLYVLLAVFIIGCSSDDGTDESESNINTDDCSYTSIAGDFYCQIENPLTLQSISDIPDNDISFLFQIVESVTTSDDLLTTFGEINNETERTFIKIRSVSTFYLQNNLGDFSNLTDDDWEFTYYSVGENCQLGVPRTFNGGGFKVNQFNITDCPASANNRIEFTENNIGIEVIDLCGQFDIDDVGTESFNYFKITL